MHAWDNISTTHVVVAKQLQQELHAQDGLLYTGTRDRFYVLVDERFTGQVYTITSVLTKSCRSIELL